jgi:hypothetical protein
VRKLIFVFVAAVVACLHVTVVGVSAPAQAAVCKVLQPGDLRFDSPHLKGETSSADGDCYQLPDPAGTVYQVGMDLKLRWNGTIVVDNAGNPACDVTPEISCTLTGEAPFFIRVPPTALGSPAAYELQVFRVSGDTGCPLIQPSVFGAAREFRFPLRALEFACLTVRMGADTTPYVNAALTNRHTPSLLWWLVDEQGKRVCEFDDPHPCPGPESGPARLLLTPFDVVPQPTTMHFSLWDLASTQGCSPTGPNPRWGTPATAESFRTRTEVDCWSVDAARGDLMVSGFDDRVRFASAHVVDAAGLISCTGEYSSCLLGRDGPLRYLAFNAASATEPWQTTGYQTALRSLEPGQGCVEIRPLAFGTPAADRHPGNGCRRFNAAAGVDYSLHTFHADGSGVAETMVYDQTGKLSLCFPRGPECPAGPLSIVTDPIAADVRTALHDLGSTNGCRPQSTTGLPLVSGTLDFGQVDCFVLDTKQDGELVVAQVGAELRTTGPPLLNFLDANEEPACASSVCFAGPPPYRMLVGAGDHERYDVVAYDPTSPRSCRPLPFGADRGLRLAMDGRSRVHCLRVSSSEGNRADAVHLRRVAGTGGAGLTRLAPYATSCLPDQFPFVFRLNATYRCELDDPPFFEMLVVGDGHRQTFYAARTGDQSSPVVPGVTQLSNRTRPTITGVPAVGQRLRARPGAWTPDATAYRYQWKVGGKAVRGVTGPRLLVRDRYRGRRITVTVTAKASNLFPGSATSRAVEVRRG